MTAFWSIESFCEIFHMALKPIKLHNVHFNELIFVLFRPILFHLEKQRNVQVSSNVIYTKFDTKIFFPRKKLRIFINIYTCIVLVVLRCENIE